MYFAVENSFGAIAGVIFAVSLIIYGTAQWENHVKTWDALKENWWCVLMILIGFFILCLLATGYDFTADNVY